MPIPSQIHPTGEIIDPETFKFKRRSIKSPLEAFNVCKRLMMYNRDRNFKNAAILKRYNDAQPFNQGDKTAAGASWQSNRSTGFLSSLVRFSVDEVNRFLLAKKLPDAGFFHEIITRGGPKAFAAFVND